MSNVDTAKADYEAFSRGDLSSLHFADDVVWITSDEVPLGGEIRGKDDVLASFAQIPEYWSEFSLETDRFIDAGDTVVVTGTQRAASDGGSMESPFVHILDYNENGDAVRGEFHADSAKELQALGAKAAA